MSERQYVIGIDPSLTSTGLVILSDDGEMADHRLIRSDPSGGKCADRMKRIETMTREIKTVVEVYEPVIVCIEHYTLGQNTPGTSDRIEFGGLLRYVLWSCGHCPIEVNQSTLKKWATGKGRFPPGSGKTPMIVSITSRYGVQLASDDEIDAYALARVAFQIAKFEEPENQSQREALITITSEKVKKTRKKKAE